MMIIRGGNYKEESVQLPSIYKHTSDAQSRSPVLEPIIETANEVKASPKSPEKESALKEYNDDFEN